jgi:hypothetical protein
LYAGKATEKSRRHIATLVAVYERSDWIAVMRVTRLAH